MKDKDMQVCKRREQGSVVQVGAYKRPEEVYDTPDEEVKALRKKITQFEDIEKRMFEEFDNKLVEMKDYLVSEIDNFIAKGTDKGLQLLGGAKILQTVVDGMGNTSKKLIIDAAVVKYFNKQCKLAAKEGEDQSHQTLELDGRIFSMYTEDGNLVLKDLQETRDTWSGTIECWSNIGRRDLPQDW